MDTRDLVKRTADELLIQGIKPTVANIREKTQRGSASTINAALSDWWAELAERLGLALSRPNIPEPVFEAASQIWIKALAEADQSLATHRQEANKQVEEAQRVRETALLQTTELQQRYDGLQETLQQFEAAHHTLQQQLTDTQTQRARMSERIQQLEARLQDKSSELSSAVTAHEKQLQLEHERYDSMERRYVIQLDEQKQLRQQAVATLATKENDWRKQFDQLRVDLETTQKQAAVLTSQLTTQKELNNAHREKLDSLQNRNEVLVAENATLTTETSHYKTRLNEVVAAENALRQQYNSAQEKCESLQTYIEDLKKQLLKAKIKNDTKS